MSREILKSYMSAFGPDSCGNPVDSFAGVPIAEMTREELIAVINYQATMERREREEMSRRTKFLMSLRSGRR